MKKHRTDWKAVNKFWQQNYMTIEQIIKKTKDTIKEVDENLKYISPSAYINSKIKEQELKEKINEKNKNNNTLY